MGNVYDWTDTYWGYNLIESQAEDLRQLAEAKYAWPVSLSIAHAPGQACQYTIVWRRRSTLPDTRWLWHVEGTALDQQLAAWALDGYFPRLVSAYRYNGADYYAVVGWPGPESELLRKLPVSLFRWRLLPYQGKADQLTVAEQRYLNGDHPVSLSLFRDPYQSSGGDWTYSTYVASIWEKQPAERGLDGWYGFNIHLVADPDVINAETALWRGFAFPRIMCPVDISSTVDRQHLMLHRDDEIASPFSSHNVDEATLGPHVSFLADHGYWPLSIQSNGRLGSRQRFDVLFANTAEAAERPRALTVHRVVVPDSRVKQATAACRAVQAAQGIAFPAGAASPPLNAAKPPPAYLGGAAPSMSAVPSSLGALQEASTLPLSDIPLNLEPLGGGPPEPGPLDPGAGAKIPEPPDESTAIFSEIEDYVVTRMKRYGIRAAQLAIARHGELKYAAAFTWADDQYPITLPTTRMRVGSVSKTITAFAMLRLAELSKNPVHGYPEIHLFKTGADSVGALLGIPSGGDWAGWHQRSVAHLLCHLGYFDEETDIDPDTVGDFCNYWNVATRLGRTPTGEAPFVDRPDVIDYIRLEAPTTGYFKPVEPPFLSTDPLVQAPIRYSGFGYERVGDIIAELSVPEYARNRAYEYWVVDNVFKRLGTDRPQLGVETASEARARAADNTFAEETRYHAALPGLVASAWKAHEDDEGILSAYLWAAPAYEGHNYRLGLAGGQWSLAAVDYARLLSSVDDPAGGLLEDPKSVDNLLHTTYARRRSLGFVVEPLTQPLRAEPPSSIGHVPSKGTSNAVDQAVASQVKTSPFGLKADSGVALERPVDGPASGAPAWLGDAAVPYELGDGLPEGPPGGPGQGHIAAWHNGSWPGTQALVFRRDDGVVAVLIYNGNPVDLVTAYDVTLMSNALDFADEAWPDHDLFRFVLDLWPGVG